MQDPVVVIDGNYLAYRSLYSTGGMSHKGNSTGVIYGLMRFARDVEGRWPNASLIWCFDHGPNLRENIYPDYKITRRKKKAEEWKDLEKRKIVKGFRRQVSALKDDLLRKAGYANILYQTGYEADDLLAQVVKQRDKSDKRDYYLVTGDHDLYQCVSYRVGVWHPSPPGAPVVRAPELAEKYHVLPAEWVAVKSIAGCGTDDIKGMKGIGEKKAADFVVWASKGDGRKPCPGISSDRLNDIMEFICSRRYALNRRLVKLPFKGLEPVTLTADAPNTDGWNRVVHGIGAETLVKGGDPKARLQGIF